MSKRPTGTSMDDDRLLELREAEETTASTYAVRVTPLLERMDVDAGDSVDWSVDERSRGDDVPMLVFGRITEGESNARARSNAAHPRELREREREVEARGGNADEGESETEVFAPVPDTLLETDPPDGLGLEFDALERNSPESEDGGAHGTLLFESIGTDETVGLIPVRFDDGTPFRSEPLPDASGRSDPVAEAELASDESTPDPAPRPETLDAPIDADVLEAVLDETSVSFEVLADVLERTSRRRLVGEADAVGEYPPLAIDDRGICVVDPSIWTDRIAPQLESDGDHEIDRDGLEAARMAHNRQAKALLADDSTDRTRDYRDFDEEYDAVVTDERETAEWNVAEPGTSR